VNGLGIPLVLDLSSAHPLTSTLILLALVARVKPGSSGGLPTPLGEYTIIKVLILVTVLQASVSSPSGERSRAP
jgi:hypothetical protein